MCGIAGYFGFNEPQHERVRLTLNRMRQRGPDAQGWRSYGAANEKRVVLLHSRLSILDLDPRSNQPFERGNCSLVFNGEIYNYLELRRDLEQLGHDFQTTSDTEVLLASYLAYGERCVEKFEGMWAFAIWDAAKNRLFLSRDRFGEKPLYYASRPEGLYFGSETAILKQLAGWSPPINQRQVTRYLVQGYKSLYKQREGFYEGIQELPAAHSAEINSDSDLKEKRYWMPQYRPDCSMTLSDAVEGTRERLFESMRIRLRSDVPLAFCLSGGVDSSALVSIAAKQFNCRADTFSIIDSDARYNELDNIQATVADTGVTPHYLELSREDSLSRLRRLIAYHDAPIATLTYFVHSMISEKVAESGFKVVFSGTSADELFTGYYDHYLLHLHQLKETPYYDEAVRAWRQHILPFVRNPILQNPGLYTEKPNFREHVFDGSAEFMTFLQSPFAEAYTEEVYCTSILRSRMLNELFHETTPVILHEDDLNSMMCSIENRSPYLDRSLFEFAYTIPAHHLIRDGQSKYILREAVKGILNEQVRLDRQKKGFNASINSVFNLKSPDFRDYLLASTSPLSRIIDLKKVTTLLDSDPAPNHSSKFLFNMINLQIFLQTKNAIL